MALKETDVVCVIVTCRPNKVYAVVNGKVHTGRWRTGSPGESGITEFTGSRSLLNAAMYSWDGKEHFVTTVGALIKSSGGWGVNLEED